jgi:putative transcriptional regulator
VETSISLQNQLLISVPTMEDPRFRNAVILVCQHNSEGTMGIVINRPHPTLRLSDALTEVGIAATGEGFGSIPIYEGGPVQQQHGFILHTPPSKWLSTLLINDQLALTTSRDLLNAISRGHGADQFLFALGCAAWAPGQLEQELIDNSWLVAPLDPTILFTLPAAERLDAAARRLGFDLARLSPQVGHA